MQKDRYPILQDFNAAVIDVAECSLQHAKAHYAKNGLKHYKSYMEYNEQHQTFAMPYHKLQTRIDRNHSHLPHTLRQGLAVEMGPFSQLLREVLTEHPEVATVSDGTGEFSIGLHPKAMTHGVLQEPVFRPLTHDLDFEIVRSQILVMSMAVSCPNFTIKVQGEDLELFCNCGDAFWSINTVNVYEEDMNCELSGADKFDLLYKSTLVAEGEYPTNIDASKYHPIGSYCYQIGLKMLNDMEREKVPIVLEKPVTDKQGIQKPRPPQPPQR